jgi:hypothetical protein
MPRTLRAKFLLSLWGTSSVTVWNPAVVGGDVRRHRAGLHAYCGPVSRPPPQFGQSRPYSGRLGRSVGGDLASSRPLGHPWR